MTNVKKRTLKQAKLDMDTRVQELRRVVACADRAAKRLPLLEEELQATQRYLRNSCTYEAVRYEEGEKTPDDLELEIKSLRADVKKAELAKQELSEAVRFYRAYHIVVFGPKLRNLNERLNNAMYWVEQWQWRMNELEFDTDVDISEKTMEKEMLQCEYDRAINVAHEIRAQINMIRNTKYL